MTPYELVMFGGLAGTRIDRVPIVFGNVWVALDRREITLPPSSHVLLCGDEKEMPAFSVGQRWWAELACVRCTAGEGATEIRALITSDDSLTPGMGHGGRLRPTHKNEVRKGMGCRAE